MKKRVYMDYNASAPPLKSAIALMTEIMQEPHNASSVHSYGREGRKYIEEARQNISDLVHAPAEQIIFNSGATEGNNTVIKHFRNQYPDEQIIVSAIEHPAVLECDRNLIQIPVDENGVIDLNVLEHALKTGGRTSLVSVMMVNNETGVIQPVKEAATLAHRYGALFHSDAVQAAGRTPINMQEMEIDFLTISSHKIGGPQGVGALAMRLCGETPTLLHGGGQEKSARAGTENVAGIAGFGAAAAYANENLAVYPALAKYRDNIEANIKALSPECVFYGTNTNRVANTILFSLPGASSETMMMSFDLEGIAISNGSACSSGTVKPSHVIKAIGANDTEAKSALRISMGCYTTEDDINAVLSAWEKIYTRLKQKQKNSKISRAI